MIDPKEMRVKRLAEREQRRELVQETSGIFIKIAAAHGLTIGESAEALERAKASINQKGLNLPVGTLNY